MPWTPVSSVMTHDVRQVTPEAELERIVRIMHDERISCIVVTDEQRPVGIISERDVVRVIGRLLEGFVRRNLCARDVMTPDPVTIRADSELGTATALLRRRGVRRLPVTDVQGRLVGIVTQTDLLRGYVRTLRRERDALEGTVAQRTQELQRALERVSALSLEDGLLGIGNRRALEIDLGHTHATAQRYARCYGTVLFDVDHFKQCNDRLGHAAGDDVLRALTAALQTQLRAADRLYRYGGDELLLLLPETDLEGAHALACRAVEAVAAAALPCGAGAEGAITLSAGAASFAPHLAAETWQQVVERADAALYRAKAAGRNRAERAEPPARAAP